MVMYTVAPRQAKCFLLRPARSPSDRDPGGVWQLPFLQLSQDVQKSFAHTVVELPMPVISMKFTSSEKEKSGTSHQKYRWVTCPRKISLLTKILGRNRPVRHFTMYEKGITNVGD